MLDDALEARAFLAGSRTDPILLHGDLHHANMVSSPRGWLAIDPLPMLGQCAYDTVQFLLFRKGSMDDPASSRGPAIERFSMLVGVDPTRVKAWMLLRLVSDALADLADGSAAADHLEAFQQDLWSARLVRRLG
jgi:streptomycin 6-kinase